MRNIIAATVGAVLLASAAQVQCASLGNGLWHTFVFQTAMPMNASEAAASGDWYQVADCDPNLGIRWAQTKSGASDTRPLEVYFTAAGQPAGVRVTVYGSSWTSGVGPAAQPNLVDLGYWIADASEKDTWSMSVSFRDPSVMCSTTRQSEEVGDRLVINQGGIGWNVPLTAREAAKVGYVPGSCMETMGQHWMYDVKLGHNELSWVEGNLSPVVPMYWPDSLDGTINAFFFATPVAQLGSTMFGKGDWETPALTASLMCQNFCSSSCKWKTDFWSTMHIYLNNQWKGLKCPGGSGIVGRACPNDLVYGV